MRHRAATTDNATLTISHTGGGRRSRSRCPARERRRRRLRCTRRRLAGVRQRHRRHHQRDPGGHRHQHRRRDRHGRRLRRQQRDEFSSAATRAARPSTPARLHAQRRLCAERDGRRQRHADHQLRGRRQVVVALSGTGSARRRASLRSSPPIARVRQRHRRPDQPARSRSPSPTRAAQPRPASRCRNSNAAEFVVSGNTCGATLAAAARLHAQRRYSPGAAGSRQRDAHLQLRGRRSAFHFAVRHRDHRRAAAGRPAVDARSGDDARPDASAPRAHRSGDASATSARAAVTVTAITSSNAAEFAVSGSNCTRCRGGRRVHVQRHVPRRGDRRAQRHGHGREQRHRQPAIDRASAAPAWLRRRRRRR